MTETDSNLTLSDIPNYIDKIGTPAGQQWKGKVVSQKQLEFAKDRVQTLVYFENKFCCNADIVNWEELKEEKVEESKEEIKSEEVNDESK